jgi:DHA1 family bicyclomycin/chloramphenicol resistance-like MFS transporter
MPSKTKNPTLIILILGALSTVSPFSIDMYLPSFAQIARDLHCPTPRVALSLSGYFIGMAFGQIFYGPLLDHFGRKKPLYAGLALFLLASAGCLLAQKVETLIAFRVLQALGGCAAGVGSMAMVRDFFPLKESAKVFSLLMLILSVSPLLAPSVGSFIVTSLGWRWIFALLGTIVFLILLICFFFLPEGHKPNPRATLSLQTIFGNFAMILRNPKFHVYALSGSLSMAGLFAYLAGSPVIFLDVYHVNTKVYGAIFALLATGFICGSQVNIWLLRHYSNEQIFKGALTGQCGVGILFWICVFNGWLPLPGVLVFLFAFLACAGILNPNAAALALAPFGNHAGSASALIGFMQIGIGSLTSAGVGFFNAKSILPTVTILAGAALSGYAALYSLKRHP